VDPSPTPQGAFFPNRHAAVVPSRFPTVRASYRFEVLHVPNVPVRLPLLAPQTEGCAAALHRAIHDVVNGYSTARSGNVNERHTAARDVLLREARE
jgi:hypothetical protein